MKSWSAVVVYGGPGRPHGVSGVTQHDPVPPMISASLSSNATAAVTVRVRDMNEDVIVGVSPSRAAPAIANDTLVTERNPSRVIKHLRERGRRTAHSVVIHPAPFTQISK